MFIATVINFLLFSLDTGIQVAHFIGLILLILDLSPQPGPTERRWRDEDLIWGNSLNVATLWTHYFQASSNLSLPDCMFNNPR